MSVRSKKILFILQHAPYGEARAREALDVVFAAAAFDQQIQLLFTGEGLWQLLKEQQGGDIDCKDISRLLGALLFYDIDTIFVDAVSLHARGLCVEQFSLPVVVLSTKDMREMVRNADCVLSL